MRHLKAINRKASMVEETLHERRRGAPGPGRRPGRTSRSAAPSCSRRGGRSDSSGGTAGLCQPVERDLFDCYLTCFWPAHVPDHYNHAPEWTGKCASAQKDWRNIDLIFP